MARSGSNPSPAKGRSSASPSPSEETTSFGTRRVLIVEDNQSDVYLIQRAIEQTGLAVEFHVVRDGQQAVQFFDQAQEDDTHPCPDIVILDINLPKKQGGEVLKHMRSRTRCANARVVVVSTSEMEHERGILKELGADA